MSVVDEDQFYAAVSRGDIQAAYEMLDQYIATPPGAGGDDADASPLLERAASVRRALLDDELDRAAAALESWKAPYADFGKLLDRDKAAELNTLGTLLIAYFTHSLADTHASYDRLLDDKLATVAKATRLGSAARQSQWDAVYAQLKSAREMTRGR